MKRVAIVEFVMSAGGVERVLRGLARAFLAIPEARDWDVTFLLSRYNSARQRCAWPSELTGPRLHVEWLGEAHPASRLLDRVAAGELPVRGRLATVAAGVGAQALRTSAPRAWRERLGDRATLLEAASERFDLLYFTYPVTVPAPPRIRCPVVATPQDFTYRHVLPEGTRARTLHESTVVSWMDRADRLLLTSEAVLDELRHVYPKYEAKSEVVRLGITLDGRAPTGDELEAVRRARRLPPEFVLTPGWVVPHKNQLLVVEAARLLRERGTSVPLVFVGPNTAELASGAPATDAYAEKVRGALRAAGLVPGRDYLALGYVGDDEIACLYRLATMCVIPSLFEGFGLPALEARHAGCPTILSAIPPFEEQIRALGGRETSFDPRDAGALAARIEAVLAHREDAVGVTRAAAARIPDVYDWNRTARGYLAAFDRVLGAR